MYCDFESYVAKGGTMTAAQYAVFGARASRKIDQLTHGRAALHAVDLKDDLSDACAQIADVLLKSSIRSADAVGLQSASNDGISETYAGTSISKEASTLCLGILGDALGDDPHNLLYAGVV